MIPERKRYAEKRVARLTARIANGETHRLTDLGRPVGSSISPMERANCTQCRQLHNDRQAIKRWKKELAAHAQKKRSAAHG